MTEPKDKLDRALQALQSQPDQQDAPAEVVQQTLAALADQYGPAGIDGDGGSFYPVSHKSPWRWAVAAIVLLMVGFTVGQVSTQFRLERRLGQWQQQVRAELQHDLLQTQHDQLFQVAQQYDQGLNQRFNEFATGAMAVSQVSQQQLYDAVMQAFVIQQQQQQQQFAQWLGRWQDQQLLHNAVLADGLVTVADVTESLLVPEQREPSRRLNLDPNSLQQ